MISALFAAFFPHVSVCVEPDCSVPLDLEIFLRFLHLTINRLLPLPYVLRSVGRGMRRGARYGGGPSCGGLWRRGEEVWRRRRRKGKDPHVPVPEF